LVSIAKLVQHGNSLLEVGMRQMSIPHSHFEVGMPQEFLNRFQADSVHYQLRGKGVAQIVESKALDSSSSAG
jgi:hypothetical protein